RPGAGDAVLALAVLLVPVQRVQGARQPREHQRVVLAKCAVRGDAARGERATLRPFALPDLDGRTWDLAAQRGKVVLVNYWATWCPPCRQETPALVRVANELRPRGLEVVGISLDGGGPGVVRDFVKSYDVPYPMLMAADEPDVAQGVDSIPLTLLLDRRGRLAKSYVGAVRESALRADIEQLLAER
ncbi:MAG TPA: TlpA disulfide reductase family protein, partial [Armatimonadaceae bacterium]|nr:TlpA disulfide reductase family protein [Armatimonadaceae bacterium]